MKQRITGKQRITVLLLAAFCVMPMARAFTQSFSAEAVQTAPGMQATRMNLYVSSNEAVRMEVETPQGQIIQQYFPSTSTMRIIYPERREYIEQKSPAPLALPGEMSANPCDQMPDARCENLGQEKIGNQTAIHWKVTRQGANNAAQTMEQWLDMQRGMPLRQIFPNQTRIDATMTGMEQVNGRMTERWDVVMTPAEGEPQQGTQWFDPQLGVTVRETLPNGAVRELRNIVLGEPSAELFTIPRGYRKLDLPQQPSRR